MTARTSGTGIAHLSHRLGGPAFCKSRMACATVTPQNTMGYQICKRCQARQDKFTTNRKASVAQFYADGAS